MIIDYKHKVLTFYHQQREKGMLASRLMNPTPAGLKKECERVLSERYLPSDKKILHDFFGDFDTPQSLSSRIPRFETDKFKPLVLRLKEKTLETDTCNIELLAWLIDYRPRPYKFDFPSADEVPASGPGYATSATTAPTIAFAGVRPVMAAPQRSQKLRYTVMGLLVLSVGYLGWGAFYNRQPTCMYWNNDRYFLADYTTQIPNGQLIALDTFRLNNFRRITRPDTLTAHSIGRVWYLKKNKKFEYFTQSGAHPLYPDRQLKPVSPYIYRKYLDRKPVLSKR